MLVVGVDDDDDDALLYVLYKMSACCNLICRFAALGLQLFAIMRISRSAYPIPPPPHLSPRLARKHQQQQSNEQTSRSPSLQPDELAKAVAHCVLSNSAADDATRQGHSRHSAAVIR